MTDLVPLESRLDAMLGVAETQRAQWQQHAGERMREIEVQSERFNRVAVAVMANVIRPRMELVARKFKNASLLAPEISSAYRCTCVFDHTAQYPASTTLELSIGPDEKFENLVISYHLQILPVFISFKGLDQLALALNQVDEESVAAWVDDRLADFTGTYLQLEKAQAYQQDNMETDPVCGMPVNRNWAAAQMEFGGKTYYFCIEDCLRRFATAPQQYAALSPVQKLDHGSGGV